MRKQVVHAACEQARVLEVADKRQVEHDAEQEEFAGAAAVVRDDVAQNIVFLAVKIVGEAEEGLCPRGAVLKCVAIAFDDLF